MVYTAALSAVLILPMLFPAGVARAQSPPEPEANPITEAVKPERRELVSKRTLTEKTFQNPNGTLTTEISQFPVHYKDAQGKYQDIDAKLTDKGGKLKADKTYAKPTFEKKTDEEGTVGSLSAGDRTVTLRVKGTDSIKKKLGKTDDRSITYEDVYEGADLRYESTTSGIKEEILIDSPDAPSTYEFELAVRDAEVKKNDAGDLVFSDDKSGKFLFKMPKPFMFDNKGGKDSTREVSNDVSYGVVKKGDRFVITLDADKKWLKDAEREYPITIDPTITLNEPYYDAYVTTCAPNTPHYSEYWLVGGRTSSGCVRRSYIYFNNLPALPNGSTITAANLRLYQYEVSNPAATVPIFRVTSSWSATTLTWNNKPSHLSPATHNFVDGTSGGYVNPDVMDIVKSWYSGQANHGFMLSVTPESSPYGRTWRSGNYTPNPNQYPKLSVTYTAPYSAEFVGASDPPSSIAQGEQYEQVFEYKNTGTNTWYRDGANPIRLGTTGPQDRSSPFYTDDGHWISANRVKMDQDYVPPGENGTFTMTMTVPNTPGTYAEDWGVLAEGYSWLEQPDGVDITVVGKTHTSAVQGTSGPVTLARGQSALAWVDIKNTGNVTWRRDSSKPIRLGTSSPVDRVSKFFVNGDWIGTNRASGADKDIIAPGETTRFSFVIKAPDDMAPGTYTEYFRPLIDGTTWLTDQNINIPITVTEDSTATEWGRNDNGSNSLYKYLTGNSTYTGQRLRKILNLPTIPSGPLALNAKIRWADAQFSDNVFNAGVRVYAKVNGGSAIDVTDKFSSLPENTDRMVSIPISSTELVPGNNEVILYATNPASGYREHVGLSLDTGGSDGASFYSSDSGSTWTTQSNESLVFLTGVDNLGDSEYGTAISDVNVTTGNLHLATNDLEIVAKGLPVTFGRTYNSRSRETGVLGKGWQFNFEQRLMFAGSDVRLVSENGQQFVYEDAGGGTYDRPPNTQAVLTKSDPLLGPVTYELREKDDLKRTFDENGRLKEIEDRNGNSLTYSYTNGKVSKVTDASGRETSLTYNAGEKLESITDFANRTVSFTYTGELLTGVTDVRNNTTSLTYDGNDRLSILTDARGNDTKYEYDSSGRVSKVTDAEQLEEPDPNLRKTTRFAYDSSTQTTVTDPKDVATQYKFDSYGRIVSTTNTSITPNTTDYQTWDKDFNKLSETDPNQGQKQYQYDDSGNVLRETDELGEVTTNTYESTFNNPLTTTDPQGTQQKFEYDANGNKIKEYTDFTNEPTKFSELAYDGSGNLTSLTDPKGNQTVYEYDSYGRITKEKAPPQNDAKVTEYTYDAIGNIITTTDPLQKVTTFEYDTAGNQTKQTDPLNNSTEATYDANGNKVSEKDAKGNVITYAYDKLNQLVETTSPDPTKTTSYQYDANGNVTGVSDGRRQTSTITYDSEDKPTSEIWNGVTTTLTYNAVGDVTQVVEGTGGSQGITTLTVDKSGQEIKETAQAGGGYSATTHVEYDKNGNETEASSLSTGTTQAEYDPKDQLTKESDIAYQDTDTQYDANGNVISLMLPSGKSIAYTYDENDQLVGTSVTVVANGVNQNIVAPVIKDGSSVTTEQTSLEYDDAGNASKITKANGTYSEMTYDAAGKLTALSIRREDHSVVSSYSYTYDPNGNVIVVSGDGVTTNYTYDSLNQLLTASDNQSRNWEYSYDNSGNRTQLIEPSGTTTYSYNDPNNENRLTSVTAGGNTVTYGYDSRGNNISRSDGTVIEYNADNLVISAKIGDGPTVTYQYDTDKRFVSRKVNGVIVRYQYDGDRISAETDDEGRVIVAYSYDEVGQLISQTRKDVTNPNGDNKVYYYHYDPHGSVTSLTDPSGNVVKHYEYDSYGNVLSETGEAGLTNPFTYSGYFRDPDTKLYMLPARAYDATLGRFLTTDPDPSNEIETDDDVLDSNLYIYTGNNPVVRIDDSGTGWCWFWCKKKSKPKPKQYKKPNPLPSRSKMKRTRKPLFNGRRAWNIIIWFGSRRGKAFRTRYAPGKYSQYSKRQQRQHQLNRKVDGKTGRQILNQGLNSRGGYKRLTSNQKKRFRQLRQSGQHRR